MLDVGLTGGMGSGKSTVAAELRRLGARVIDADAVAREVVEPGTPTLAAIARRFGPGVLHEDTSLDRAALAAIVFPDPAALADLDRITAPAIAARVTELRRATDPRLVSVQDMPLLVERRLWPREHLTVVVGADEESRVRRLVTYRDLDEADVRHRIARQATEAERRAAADVWVDNDGDPEVALDQVRRLWTERLQPYNDNLLARRHAPRDPAIRLVAPDPTWPAAAARLVARLEDVLGDRAAAVDHVGSTSVPGLPARDVVDLQVGVRRLADADAPAFVDDLTRRGFIRVEARCYANADPGRDTNVNIREIGSPGWQFALQVRDWLRADTAARDEYAGTKAALAARTTSTEEYAAAKAPWFDAAHPRVVKWVERTQWREGRGSAPHTPN